MEDIPESYSILLSAHRPRFLRDMLDIGPHILIAYKLHHNLKSSEYSYSYDSSVETEQIQ